MRRETQNLVLFALGGGLLKIALNGTYLHYVKPGLQPYLIAGSALLVVLAVAAIVRDVRAGHATGHEHGHVAWLLVVPVLIILFVPPAPLGLDSVGAARDSVAPNYAGRDFPPLPDSPAPELGMLDVVQRAAAGGSLDDHTITVTGFVAPNGDDVDLARVVIICCAADARTLRIHLDGMNYAPSPGEWLEVTGRVVPGSATPDTRMTPTMTVSAVRHVDAPENTYAY